jgi:hypothetical protein
MDPSTADTLILMAADGILRDQAAKLIQRQTDQTDAEYRAALKVAALATATASGIDSYIGEAAALEIRIVG